MSLNAPILPQLHADILAGRRHVWVNPGRIAAATAFDRAEVPVAEVELARREWGEYESLLSAIFPELEASGGKIDSPLLGLSATAADELTVPPGRLWVKADHLLPVTGTIKARGGVFEVLQHARRVALKARLIGPGVDLRALAGDEARALFGRHRIMTGSTGNLGFSIGVTARALGFEVEVHMSNDAKQWKKQRLRDLGAHVVEHKGDFGSAVSRARQVAEGQDKVHFIDDENSVSLFLGYSSAAFDVRDQLAAAGVTVDAANPLIVYLPCGVGGSPGGVCFGLKYLFGDNVKCFFVEPVSSPAMLVQLATGPSDPVSVYDFGLDNLTAADGLAVAAASLLVARNVSGLVEGVITVEDADLFKWLKALWQHEQMRLEPSAASGFAAAHLLQSCADQLTEIGGLKDATHLVWTTGGSRVPDQEFEDNLIRADMPNDL